VRLSCTEPDTHLPALAAIAQQLQLPRAVVRSGLERLAIEGLVMLHDGYRLYSVGTMTPTERAYRLIRTVIHRSYLPCGRLMTRFVIGQTFDIGTKKAAAVVRRRGACGAARAVRQRKFSAERQRGRVRQLRERASDLRREALERMKTARKIENTWARASERKDRIYVPTCWLLAEATRWKSQSSLRFPSTSGRRCVRRRGCPAGA
jgi:hypothetical protein